MPWHFLGIEDRVVTEAKKKKKKNPYAHGMNF